MISTQTSETVIGIHFIKSKNTAEKEKHLSIDSRLSSNYKTLCTWYYSFSHYNDKPASGMCRGVLIRLKKEDVVKEAEGTPITFAASSVTCSL